MRVTTSYRWLGDLTGSNRELQGLKRLGGVKGGHRGLRGVTRGYKRLEGVRGGSKRLKRVR